MTAALELADVAVGHGRRAVLEHVTLELARGEWLVLLGPNGVGKSTLLDCVAGRRPPLAGRIRIAGHALDAEPLAARRALGYAGAPDALPPLLSGRQCLQVHAAAKGLAAIDAEVLALADELRYTPLLDEPVAACSLGGRQKLAVLLALVGDPALIVLDESFNGLDPASALVLKTHLRARLAAGRAGLLLASHALDLVLHHADRAALLLDGRIARAWTAVELAALRAAGTLERALADAATP